MNICIFGNRTFNYILENASGLSRDCLGIVSGTVRFTLAEISVSFSDFTEPFPRKPRRNLEPFSNQYRGRKIERQMKSFAFF